MVYGQHTVCAHAVEHGIGRRIGRSAGHFDQYVTMLVVHGQEKSHVGAERAGQKQRSRGRRRRT